MDKCPNCGQPLSGERPSEEAFVTPGELTSERAVAVPTVPEVPEWIKRYGQALKQEKVDTDPGDENEAKE